MKTLYAILSAAIFPPFISKRSYFILILPVRKMTGFEFVKENFVENKISTYMKTLIHSFIFAMLLLTTHTADAQSSNSYLPKIPADVNDIKDARKKLIEVFSNEKSIRLNAAKIEKISFSDSVIEFELRKKSPVFIRYTDLDYKDLAGNKLTVYVNTFKYAMLWLPNSLGVSGIPDQVKHISDLLFFIQRDRYKQYLKISEKELERFTQSAAKYSALVTKPDLTETQRKFVVQANLMTQQKRYSEAIALYGKAIEVNETDCPDIYNNLALLFAQTGSYNEAILNMKKYLLLVPGAPDARSAQDKIYEWEISITK